MIFINYNYFFYYFFIIFFIFSSRLFACDVIDDAGHKIALQQPAKRIISLSPDMTELLFAAGAGKYIVGVMQGSDYPVAAKKIPVVADFSQLDREHIALLHPDLILVWAVGSLPQQLRWFSGVPIYYFQPEKLMDIPRTLKHLGCLAGTENIANRAAEAFSQHIRHIQQHYQGAKKISVFYAVSQRPLITVTAKSWISDVISLCGGKNIFDDLLGVAPEVSTESVVLMNPAVIFYGSTQKEWQVFWQRFPSLFAVRHQLLFSVAPDILERAGPRTLQGVESVCADIALARVA